MYALMHLFLDIHIYIYSFYSFYAILSGAVSRISVCFTLVYAKICIWWGASFLPSAEQLGLYMHSQAVFLCLRTNGAGVPSAELLDFAAEATPQDRCHQRHNETRKSCCSVHAQSSFHETIFI